MFRKFIISGGHPDGKDDIANTSQADTEKTSCFCLKRTFFVRKWLIHLVHWPWFERLSMLVILVNCACLALADPLDRNCSEIKCKRLKKVNVFVLWFFVAEMIMKMTAVGVVGKRSYFSDGWNRLDFVIVAAGIVDEFSSLDGAFLVTIRLVRVLRPLRAINRVPSIRILVTLLVEALPMLGNVFALAFLVFLIFGIIGVQLWQGVLRNRCFVKTSLHNSNYTNSLLESCYYRASFEKPDFLCSLASDAGMKHCSDVPNRSSCWSSSYSFGNYCHDQIYPSTNSSLTFNNSYFQCSQNGPNPFFETMSFDHIGFAWIAIFQIITLEGWTDIMYLIQDAHDYWNWIYFVTLILIGPFFLINLCLVVLAMQFQETKSRELQLLEEDRQRKIEAHKVFKETKWGKVISVIRSNISEAIERRSDQHIHHHHHIHHYYHHEHIVQNPTSPHELKSGSMTTEPDDPTRLPTVVLSHENSPNLSPKVSHFQQEPNDSIIALELKSNCQISQNFLSPVMPSSGRTSPIWSAESVSLERFSFSPDAVSSCSFEDLHKISSCSNLASATATVTINVTTNQNPSAFGQLTDHQKITTGEVVASATANASITTERISKNTNELNDYESQSEESLKIPDKSFQNSVKQSNSRNKRHIGHNTLKTFKSSKVNVDVNDSPNERECAHNRDEIYRQRRADELVGVEEKTISNIGFQRRETQRSLDDRFGSMFDIQRSARYYVSHERTTLVKIQDICARLAKSSRFINFTMAVILINAVTMATEHHGQPEFLDDFLEMSNLFFIVIFALEMIIKIFGEGIRIYISQWFNIFDGFIVIISITEVIILRGSGGLSVLRSIRLLRIFRLIRPIRRQLIVMVHTMASVVTFTALLFLFMFTFAVLGMNLFGGKMNLPTSHCRTENVRSNFDSFLWAMVTIFQILTLEDWNLVMRDAMRSTTEWAAIYFMALTTIGHYVLLNLLVAILVEGFTNPVLFDPNDLEHEQEEKDDKKRKRTGEKVDETKSTTDWLTLVKRTKEQSSVSQPSPSTEKNENDISDLPEETFGLTETSPSATKSASRTLPTPSDYCGRAMRGVIGKSYQLQNKFGKPDNSFNQSRYSRGLAHDSKEYGQCISKSKAMTSVELEESQTRKSASKTSDVSSCLPKNGATLSNCFSYNNKAFTIDDGFTPNTYKPRIVITSEDHVNGNSFNSVLEQKVEENIDFESCTQEEMLGIDHSKSLFIFSENNIFRQLMITISASKWFDYFILFLILVSCVFMVMDQSHWSTSSKQSDIVHKASIVFTILFTIEVMIKVIAQGFVIGKDTYLRLGWNILDFIIVIISWLHVITSSFHSTSPGILGSVKVLRALRTLRPLRMIRRAPGLKLVVEALLRSLKPIGNTVLIAGMFFVVFGVLGIQLFKGTFYYCDGDSEVKTKEECVQRNVGKWVNQQYNFDNLPQALVTLFVLATRDGWVTVMHHGVDAVGIDQQPKLNHDRSKVCYFVSFLMVVGFLVLNMVVGIVVNSYQLCQEKQEKTEGKIKRKNSKNFVVDETMSRDGRLHSSQSQRRCFHLCSNKYWDFTIAFVICLNVILMSLEHYKMSKNYEIFLDVNNYICTGIFVIEAFVKLTAFGCRGYFQDRWNLLDFVVVVLSVAGIILDLIHNAVTLSVKPTAVRGLRILRIIRVLKLFKVAKGVRSLLDTVTKSLPQVANLGILLFLIFFIYSSLGIQLFGTIECSGRYPCRGFGTHANFRDFQTAMLTLFRVATGDNWNTIFMDTLRSNCDPSATCEKNCCFSKYVAPLYFTTFVMATHFVLLNVLVAVLMKDLKASREKLAAVLSRETIDKRVLKLTLSATKFVKQKAFSKKPSENSDEGQIELKHIRNTSSPADCGNINR